jgi:hypothetical protein
MNADYHRVSTSDSAEKALFDYLASRSRGVRPRAMTDPEFDS